MKVNSNFYMWVGYQTCLTASYLLLFKRRKTRVPRRCLNPERCLRQSNRRPPPQKSQALPLNYLSPQWKPFVAPINCMCVYARVIRKTGNESNENGKHWYKLFCLKQHGGAEWSFLVYVNKIWKFIGARAPQASATNFNSNAHVTLRIACSN